MEVLNTENLSSSEIIEVLEELKQIVREIKDNSSGDKTHITDVEDNPAHKFIYYQYSDKDAIDINKFIDHHINAALGENGLYSDKFSYYRDKSKIAINNKKSNILNERYDIKNYIVARIIKYISKNFEFKDCHPNKQLNQLFSYLKDHITNGVIDYFRAMKDIKKIENREKDIYKYKCNYGMEEEIFKDYTQVNICNMTENNHASVEEEYFIKQTQNKAHQLLYQEVNKVDRKIFYKLSIANTHTQEEIAEELGISQAAVSKRLRNLIKFMLERLEQAS